MPEDAPTKKAIRNAIFVMLDTLPFNYLGCYGNDWISTPNLDRFARKGILFENAYSEGLPTIPVRRSLLTGRFTLPFGGWKPLGLEDTTITDILWGRNVQTALIYDSPPLRLPKYGYSRGFDYVKFCSGHELDHETFYHEPLDPCMKPESYISPTMLYDENGNLRDQMSSALLREIECYLKIRQHWRSDADNYIAVVAREAEKWLRFERNPKRPFFLWIDSFDPHEPWDPPSVWDPDLKCPYDPDYEGNPLVLAPWSDVKGRITERECQHVRALTAEKITVVDKWIGKLLDQIQQMGLMEDTLIVICSDHGQPMGEGEHGHGIMRKSRPWPYEELVHIPLMMQVPGVKGGRRIRSFVQNTDIMPTILDALGYLDEEALREAGHEGIRTFGTMDIQGSSLLPIAYGEKDRVRDYAIAGYYGMSWSLITDDYTYIHWLKDQESLSISEMHKVFYDDALGGGNAGKQSAKVEVKEEMWTCTPGAEVVLPAKDELYDRNSDPFQLNNIIEDKPEIGKELLQQLKAIIGELRTS
ncbi:sulfatase [Desulfomonile tiedjei]|uniref:Arylsulfatase A family protein n=1 Tax=Desulfomonile tiedjei (strain ATCC 49306 / DSM 6799 / DCB-1) TaxID=706587 RepID=I4C5J3_DESTA|nr:sulfatase [Desulfomonile tiedjei]AFM24834.1 arylsulfatase A family protein [Desulfomonile tiedjei DSM 6799]